MGWFFCRNCGKDSANSTLESLHYTFSCSFYRLWHIFRLICCKYLFTFKLNVMLRWTVIFLIVAIIAAIFGFGGIAAGAASIAKILFFIFLVLFILSLIFGRRSTNI